MSSAADSFLTRIRAHQKWFLMVLVCALVGVSQSAYVFFTNESGRALRWSVDLLPLRIAVWEGFSEELGVDGSDDTPRAAIEEALAQWSRSSAIVITDSSTPVSRAGLDGLNLVTVASPNINPDLIGGGLANTLLWSRTGEASDAIIEADVVFNRDQPKAWSTRENPDQLNFFDIALHELGHVLGLQHSIARSSSMFFQGGEFSFSLNQLSWDDIAGINGSFRLPGMDQITGSVSGRVTLEDAPVFGLSSWRSMRPECSHPAL